MNNFTLETKHIHRHTQASALASMQMYAASGACNLQHFTMDRERERERWRRECTQAWRTSLDKNAAQASRRCQQEQRRERAGQERAKSFAVHDVNYNSSKTSAALALGTHTHADTATERVRQWERGI